MSDDVVQTQNEQHPLGFDQQLISSVCKELDTYLSPEQVAEIYRAYVFGAIAHEGQYRLSGEAYIYHPLAVARILGQMRMDYRSIIAALLHDVIEDTGTTKQQIVDDFGEEVAGLVDGVSKLTRIDFKTKAEAQAENFRKMLLAMVQDIRVIMIKLADRLHNMRTLGALRAEKRRRIAKETLEIYAPIANRLGMNDVRNELQDLSFRAYHPTRFAVIKGAIRHISGHRKEVMQSIETGLQMRLEETEIPAAISGRQKHPSSIYKKMQDKHLSFKQITDVYAFRIVVESVDMCYRVLGVVHNLYKPVPGKFKDYIAIPKSNGYQSIHTTLFDGNGVPIEIQIRTTEMNRFAESGIAAHWLYKEQDDSDNGAQTRALEWLKNLLEMQQDAGDSLEFLENVKVDLFPDETYVFTPQGEIKKLPSGATVVDFAYSLHTDIGHTCIAAKIDHRLWPLSTVLWSGQTVDVVTAPGARPHPSWLDFVVTAKARSNVRQYLKSLQQGEAKVLGERILSSALSDMDVTLADKIADGSVAEFLKEYDIEDIGALFIEVGIGERMPQLVAHALQKEKPKKRRLPHFMRQSKKALAIKGTEGVVISFARCCYPLPGEPIIGFLSQGKGMVIHNRSCANVKALKSRKDQMMEVQWADNVEGEFRAEIRLDVKNQRGALAKLAATISDMGANIENVDVEELDGMTHITEFIIAVRDRIQLANIMKKLRRIDVVIKVARKK